MTNIFTLENSYYFYDKINIDELYEKKKNKGFAKIRII